MTYCGLEIQLVHPRSEKGGEMEGDVPERANMRGSGEGGNAKGDRLSRGGNPGKSGR